jgi:hypothetical protein
MNGDKCRLGEKGANFHPPEAHHRQGQGQAKIGTLAKAKWGKQ